MHIELSRSMRDRRDRFSRTRSLFLRARNGRRRPGDCGWNSLRASRLNVSWSPRINTKQDKFLLAMHHKLLLLP